MVDIFNDFMMIKINELIPLQFYLPIVVTSLFETSIFF